MSGSRDGHRNATGCRGLLTFAIDTDCSATGGGRARVWLEPALIELRSAGVRPINLGQALADHEPERRELAASSWGEGKDRRTWDSPSVADLAWAARRLELRVLRDVSSGRLTGPSLTRAARELLAIQASDWAFLDYNAKPGITPSSGCSTIPGRCSRP